MQEFDLKSIWSKANKKADNWYEDLRPELERMAQQKNDSVLQRIKRLVEVEIAFTVLMIVGFSFYGRHIQAWILFTLIGGLIGVLMISYRYYRYFRKQIEAVPTMNIRASTAAYLKYLGDYKKRLIRLSLVFLPFGLLIGFLAGFALGAENDITKIYELGFWLKTIPILALAIVPSYFFVRWYYRLFIGTRENELRAVLNRLTEEEE